MYEVWLLIDVDMESHLVDRKRYENPSYIDLYYFLRLDKLKSSRASQHHADGHFQEGTRNR